MSWKVNEGSSLVGEAVAELIALLLCYIFVAERQAIEERLRDGGQRRHGPIGRVLLGINHAQSHIRGKSGRASARARHHRNRTRKAQGTGDPDDKTPEGIRRSGACVETHGFPVLPGSMFLMAHLDEVPILGLSGCVLHDAFSAFDVLLPRLLAGEKSTRADIVAMGYGGLQKRHQH